MNGQPGVVLIPPKDVAGSVGVIEVHVRNETSRRGGATRLHDVGETLRASWQIPTDTMITGDIPTLLTRLSQVPRNRKTR